MTVGRIQIKGLPVAFTPHCNLWSFTKFASSCIRRKAHWAGKCNLTIAGQIFFRGYAFRSIIERDNVERDSSIALGNCLERYAG